jgi:MEMO1 family protein
MAILAQGEFETPLGRAEIDQSLAQELARACPLLREDAVAHGREHSLEVQIPFLQRLRGDFRFVPVVLATDRYGAIEELGHAVAQVVAAQPDPVLVIASSDMNHYQSDAITRVQDEKAIARILALDPRGLYNTVRSEAITMCGYAAAAAMLVAVRELGASEAELVGYATSGDVTGERDRVVGYAGIILR